jgi:hypothetical protein
MLPCHSPTTTALSPLLSATLNRKLVRNPMLDFQLDNCRDSMKELLMKFAAMSKFPGHAVPSFDPGISLLMSTTNALVALKPSLRTVISSIPPCCGKTAFPTFVAAIDCALLLIKQDVTKQLMVKNLQVVPLSSRERPSNPNCASRANTNTHFTIEASIVVLVAEPAFPKRARFLDWAMDAIEREGPAEPIAQETVFPFDKVDGRGGHCKNPRVRPLSESRSVDSNSGSILNLC